MTLQELREEVDKLTRIFQAAKYGDQDFQYIFSSKHSQPIVYDTFYLFTERIYHSTIVALIFDLNKLFHKPEDSSFIKLRDKMMNNYDSSELSKFLPINELESLFYPVISEEIEPILRKIRLIRNKYYAHLSDSRPKFEDIAIFGSDTHLLVAIAENILHTIEFKFFKRDGDYNLSVEELGHNIFERLNDWEIYREKYGFLDNDIIST